MAGPSLLYKKNPGSMLPIEYQHDIGYRNQKEYQLGLARCIFSK